MPFGIKKAYTQKKAADKADKQVQWKQRVLDVDKSAAEWHYLDYEQWRVEFEPTLEEKKAKIMAQHAKLALTLEGSALKKANKAVKKEVERLDKEALSAQKSAARQVAFAKKVLAKVMAVAEENIHEKVMVAILVGVSKLFTAAENDIYDQIDQIKIQDQALVQKKLDHSVGIVQHAVDKLDDKLDDDGKMAHAAQDKLGKLTDALSDIRSKATESSDVVIDEKHAVLLGLAPQISRLFNVLSAIPNTFRFAGNRDKMMEYIRADACCRFVDVMFELFDPEEIKKAAKAKVLEMKNQISRGPAVQSKVVVVQERAGDAKQRVEDVKQSTEDTKQMRADEAKREAQLAADKAAAFRARLEEAGGSEILEPTNPQGVAFAIREIQREKGNEIRHMIAEVIEARKNAMITGFDAVMGQAKAEFGAGEGEPVDAKMQQVQEQAETFLNVFSGLFAEKLAPIHVSIKAELDNLVTMVQELLAPNIQYSIETSQEQLAEHKPAIDSSVLQVSSTMDELQSKRVEAGLKVDDLKAKAAKAARQNAVDLKLEIKKRKSELDTLGSAEAKRAYLGKMFAEDVATLHKEVYAKSRGVLHQFMSMLQGVLNDYGNQ